MPSATQLQHRRIHNLLLISKLLSGRDRSSPLNIVIDSLEQSGKRLIHEFIGRARNAGGLRIVYVSFETLKQSCDVDVFIQASKLSPSELQRELSSTLASFQSQHALIVIDSLHPLCDPVANLPLPLPTYLSSFLNSTTTLVAVYHIDVPLPISPSHYHPEPLTLLKYLATTIFTTHSLSHLVTQKSHLDRSLAAPLFGLEEGKEGVIRGLGGNDQSGLVIEIEHRRRSGRGVREWYFLPSRPSLSKALDSEAESTQHVSRLGTKAAIKEAIFLLEDHPLYQKHGPEDSGGGEGEDMDTTFNLGLTEKQRRDREGVVLPYFDAQREEGPGEGGRILYQMGEEDDFDEEEDEI